MAQPLKVTCPSCSSKFHIPLHLVRGKVVSFRCKKCRSTIPVDGRALTSATPIALQAPNVTPPEMHDPRSPFYSEPPGRLSLSDGIVVQDGLPTTSGLQADTPSAFAHSNARNAPPLLARTPPMGVGPAMLLSTPPITLSKSNPPEPLRNTYPPTSFRPANGRKKVVAAAAVLAAAIITVWSMSRKPPRSAAPVVAAAPQEHPPQRSADEARAAQETARSTAPTTEPVKAVNPANLPIAKDEPVGKTAPATHRPGKARPAKTPVDTTTAEPPAEEAAPAPQAPVAVAAPAPQAPAPAAPPASEAPSNEIDFNREAARLALEDAGQRAASCRTIDTPAGPARVAVTFAPGGTVTSALIESGPLVGTSAGGCLTSKVRSAKVPAFTGEPVTVKKSISF